MHGAFKTSSKFIFILKPITDPFASVSVLQRVFDVVFFVFPKNVKLVPVIEKEHIGGEI